MASRKRENRLTGQTLLITSSTGGYYTKRELASRQLPASCPPIPPRKIRRSMCLNRTLFNLFGKARSVAVRNDGTTPPLSPLYNKRVKKTYLDQVFKIRIQVGEGCFGYVYKAISSDDRRCYAIKHLKDTTGTRTSKKREIQNYRNIGSNENFVKFIRAWEEHEKYYIQMEFCIMSLAEYASQHNSFPENQLWDILIDMLLALKHLHKQEYIHLDIKPENIMISRNGVYKLGDFGLVVNLKELANNEERVLNISEGDSKYLASEVLEGMYTTSCDIFSLGVTLLELATDLVLPPNGILWHELRNGVFPLIFYQRVKGDMAKIIRQMMLYDYNSRPSAEELLNVEKICKILEQRSVTPRVNYLENHVALQDPMLLNEEAPLPPVEQNEHVEDEHVEEVANEEEDDGVVPLSPFLGAAAKCAMKLTFDGEPSTSKETAPPPLPAALSAPSDVSTPSSGRPSKRSIERMCEERLLARKTVRGRRLDLNGA